MVKCAVINCRSGYKPTNAERKIIEAGGSVPYNRSVFAFPKADRQEIRDKWMAVLERKVSNCKVDNFGVCELHFRPDDFYNKDSTFRKTARQRKAIKPTAVPSIFDCCSDTVKPKHGPKPAPEQVPEWPTTMPSLVISHQAMNLQYPKQVDARLEEKVVTIDDMWNRLSKERLPSGYVMVNMALPENEQYVITIRVEEIDDKLGAPVIRKSLTIYPDLHYRMHVAGTEVSVRLSDTFDNTAEVLNVLAHLKTITTTNKDLMVFAARLLGQVSKEGGNDESFFKCQFAAEQLRLVPTVPNCRHYSPMLMSAAMMWNRTSPKLYDDLCHSGLLVLPHRSTLRRLTSALSVKEGLEIDTIKYLQLSINKLNPMERLVNLAMDELQVCTARDVELTGGRVYGGSKDSVTNSIFCTHISSVDGRYEDIVTMSPVPHITSQDIKDTFFKVLQAVTGIGFVVVSVSTNSHANQSFYKLLGQTELHPEYIRNPYSSNEEARIYFNLFNKKILCPPFTDSEGEYSDSTPFKADDNSSREDENPNQVLVEERPTGTLLHDGMVVKQEPLDEFDPIQNLDITINEVDVSSRASDALEIKSELMDPS